MHLHVHIQVRPGNTVEDVSKLQVGCDTLPVIAIMWCDHVAILQLCAGSVFC